MLFLAASELPYGPDACLSTGSRKLDELLGGGLLPGLITVLHSPKGPKQFRSFLTHFLLRHYARQPIIIDTMNQLPILQLVQATDRRRRHSQILRQLHIARAFNYHQITEAITSRLEAEVQRTGTSVVILLGLGEQYLSAEAQKNLSYDRREPVFALQELMEAVDVLKGLVVQYGLYCVILTSLAPRSKRKAVGGTFLAHCAGVIIQKRTEEGETSWQLLEHPFLAPRTSAQSAGKRVSGSADLQQWIRRLPKGSLPNLPQGSHQGRRKNHCPRLTRWVTPRNSRMR